MKYKSYENSALEKTTGTNIELLDNKDINSARNINRPITNILENQESNYTLIQTLLKTVYGNSNGIIPNTLESFSPECFEIGSFKNDTDKYYLRLPLGLALISNLVKEAYTNNNSNPFLKKGDYEYKDNVHTDSYLRDRQSSFVIENKPEINLFERQLANLIGLDLSDLTNDIRIFQEIEPLTVKVAIIDDSGNPRYDSSGCPMYVEDENSNVVYLAKDGQGDLGIYYDEALASVTSYKYKTIYEETTNKQTPLLNNEIVKQTVKYRENLVVKKQAGGNYTSDISKALVLKDASGNDKTRAGYYMKVVRATMSDDEVLWLPNKQTNESFDIFLPTPDANSESFISNVVTVEITEGENNLPLETIAFQQEKENTLNDSLFGNILNFSNYFTAQKIQAKNSEGEPIHGVEIISTYPEGLYKNVKISISYTTKEQSDNGEITTRDYFVDEITKDKIKNLGITPQKKQKYFNNIFELTNAFLGAFDTMASGSIEDIYENMNLETIIPISNLTQDLFVYADLENDIRNSYNENYDKVARFFTSSENLEDTTKYVKLFSIHVEPNAVLPFNPVVTEVKSFLDPLDRRLISTKRAELNSLLSTTRTELKNYVHIQDADGNREIEIKEKASKGDDEQLRITSPITRIVDVKDKLLNSEPNTDSWTDSGNGDTPSDFFEESYEVIDTTVSYQNQNFRKYIHNDDTGRKGIIIDKNKGIKIFNNDWSKTDGLFSYSDYKPIEIISKAGNINIFNSENNNGRINISNLKDTATNIVDIKGKTRVRSKNTDVLAIKRISPVDNATRDSNIIFQIGESYSKDDTSNIESATDNNSVLGEFSFRSGTTGTQNDNVVDHNRYLYFKLQKIDKRAKSEEGLFFEARNSFAGNGESNKFVLSSCASIVPRYGNVYLGLPIESRSYTYEKDIIPYVYGQDVDGQILSTIKRTVDENGKTIYSGTSSEYTGSEGRWVGAFIKNGYFGRINLADTAADIRNSDERSGVLRLGNSNIYDVSSLFINQTHRTINFDNQISTKSENTIYSNYADNIAKDGLFFILNRQLGAIDNNINIDVNKEPSDAKNWCALAIRTNGTHISKNAYIYRQLFVNVNESNGNESTTEDNSSLVVKGQTVMHGELFIGKNVPTVDNTSEHTSSTTIIRDASDNYKLYNEEYFEKSGGKFLEKNSEGNYTNPRKEEWLYEFVNYGHSYFDKDITVKGKFTEDTVLNKALTIKNNSYANYKFNVYTPNCPETHAKYVAKNGAKGPVSDTYYSSSLLIPRNHTSLDVVSGLIKFGSEAESGSTDDRSDVLLFGSQWIKRRLEIGPDASVLRNTRMYSEDIFDKVDAKESPVLYIEGASQFTGDVVFGQKLNAETVNGDIYKHIANQKQEKEGNTYTKTIFWGRNAAASSSGKGDNKTTNWNSDFDFHGKTWFDNSVKIGVHENDVRRADSYDDENTIATKDGNSIPPEENCNGNLEILGNNSPFALKVSGPVIFKDGQDSVQEAQTINQLAKQISIIADDNYQNDNEGAYHEISQIILNRDDYDPKGSTKQANSMEISTTRNLEVTSKKEMSLTSTDESIKLEAENNGKEINLKVAKENASINSKYSDDSEVNVIYYRNKKDDSIRQKFTDHNITLDGVNSDTKNKEANIELNNDGQINANATDYNFKTNTVNKFKSNATDTYWQFSDSTSILHFDKNKIDLHSVADSTIDSNITLTKDDIKNIVNKTRIKQDATTFNLTVLKSGQNFDARGGESTNIKSAHDNITLTAGADQADVKTNAKDSPTGTSLIKLTRGDSAGDSKIDISTGNLNLRLATVRLSNDIAIQGTKDTNNILTSNFGMIGNKSKGFFHVFENSHVAMRSDQFFGIFLYDDSAINTVSKTDYTSTLSVNPGNSQQGGSAQTGISSIISLRYNGGYSNFADKNKNKIIEIGETVHVHRDYVDLDETHIASGNLKIGNYYVYIV